MSDSAQVLFQRFSLNLGKLSLSPSYIEAGAILLLLFFLFLVMAKLRRHFVDWSLKGAFFGLFWGFLLALIFEGFLIISGRTALTELVGWKNAPKPILNVLDMGRVKLANTLGVTTEIPSSFASGEISFEKFVSEFQKLNPSDAEQVKALICNP